ncbi:MAG: hypothetical protein AAF843_18790 [Bacteroidota bacterium]
MAQKENKIKLSEKQAQHVERVMNTRQIAYEAFIKASNEEGNVLDIICDVHGLEAVNGLRYENGHLILPSKESRK